MALNQKLKIENSKCKRFEYEGGPYCNGIAILDFLNYSNHFLIKGNRPQF